MARINQDLDESSDPRATKMADTRAAVRKLIEDQYGLVSWVKARDLGAQYYICAQTVIKFATGETRKPSSYTMFCMEKSVGYGLARVPLDTKLPKGASWLEFG